MAKFNVVLPQIGFSKRIRSYRLAASGGILLLAVFLAGLLSLALAAVADASTSVVTTTLDTGPGSLREVISSANATGGAITFDIDGDITLTSSLPAITNTVSIDGSGHAITVSGANTYQVLAINLGAALNLQNITIANGRAANDGGGIANNGTLMVNNSTFSGNLSYLNGGGIYNSGTMTVTNSTLSGNIADDSGGGIANSGTLMVNNSTFSYNHAVGLFADSIYNGFISTVINSTFSGNGSSGYGVDIVNDGTLTMTNSIMANDRGCLNLWIATGNHNLIQDAVRACDMTNGIDGNIIGVDPLLGPLQNNSGSTLTFLPQPGSPAINDGTNVGCPAFDQRGVSRPQGNVCDIGAVEVLFLSRAYLPMVRR